MPFIQVSSINRVLRNVSMEECEAASKDNDKKSSNNCS